MTWDVTPDELAAWERAHPDADSANPGVRLCIACARGDPAALADFDTQFRPTIEAAVRSLGDGDFAQEVSQLVRHRLLVREGAAPPRILEYRGRGALTKFVQAVALRTALSLREKSQRYVGVDPDDGLLELPATDSDPELELLKLRYRAEFKAAFAAALDTLEPDSRAALRQVYLDGLTLADVGRLYGWSVPTASRRVAAARADVLKGTRAQLAQKLRLAPHEVDSLLRLIESRLSVEALHASA